MMTKTEMAHVPYRGSAAAYPDPITGKVHVMFDNLTSAIEFTRSGQLRALGVTSATRWESLPNIPAIAEAVPNYEVNVWNGIMAPKGTQPDIIAALSKAVNDGLADPKLMTRFAGIGAVPMAMTPDELRQFIAEDTEKWRRVVEFAGVSVE